MVAFEGASGLRTARGNEALSMGTADGDEAIADDDIVNGFMESLRRQLNKENVRQCFIE